MEVEEIHGAIQPTNIYMRFAALLLLFFFVEWKCWKCWRSFFLEVTMSNIGWRSISVNTSQRAMKFWILWCEQEAHRIYGLIVILYHYEYAEHLWGIPVDGGWFEFARCHICYIVVEYHLRSCTAWNNSFKLFWQDICEPRNWL